jgi:excisionase family DNA binding protein
MKRSETIADPPGLLTLEEFGSRFAVSRTCIYRLVKRGDLPMVKVGRSSRIALADANAWASRLPRVTGGANA